MEGYQHEKDNPAASGEKLQELEMHLQRCQEMMQDSNETVFDIEKKLQDLDDCGK